MYDIHRALYCIGKDQPFFIKPKQTKTPKQKEKKPPFQKKNESLVINKNSKKTKLYGKLIKPTSAENEDTSVSNDRMLGVG